GVGRYLRPPTGPGVRWDGGVEAGNEVTLCYDPLIAKRIVWGETREVALHRMRRALRELVIVGLPTSQAFHLRVMDEPCFRRGEVDTTYLERVGAELLAQDSRPELTRPLAAVAALLAEERRAAAHPPAPSDGRSARESAWVQTARRDSLRRRGPASARPAATTSTTTAAVASCSISPTTPSSQRSAPSWATPCAASGRSTWRTRTSSRRWTNGGTRRK